MKIKTKHFISPPTPQEPARLTNMMYVFKYRDIVLYDPYFFCTSGVLP